MAVRVALHSVIKAGAETDYVHDHQSIPDDLVASFARIGIDNWTIWRSGRHLFHLVECDDYPSAMRALQGDPADEAWQARIGVHVEGFASDGDGPDGQQLEQVWELDAQRGAGDTGPR